MTGCGCSSDGRATGRRFVSLTLAVVAATRRCLLVGHQHGDLVAGQRAAQVAHRPPRGEHLRLVLAGAAQHELALGEPADRVADRADVDAAAGRAHAVEQALLVAVGLQAADHPRARVRQRLVVDVDRVLRAQHHADTERTRLLHQRHDRLLRRRHRGRRQVSGDLVHVEQRAQVGGAALLAHPRDQLRQHERGDELALLVAEVGGGDDRAARLAVGRAQHRGDVERRAGHPRAERRRREQSVEPHRERRAVLRREELRRARTRRACGSAAVCTMPTRVGRSRLRPAVHSLRMRLRQQDVLAARQRVGVDVDEAEQPADEAFDLVADDLGVARRRPAPAASRRCSAATPALEPGV